MVDSKVDAWFDSSPSGQKIALTTLRGMIRAVVTDAIEEIKWGRPCYSFESGLFCYLYTTNTHVALGFQCGSELDDPDDVLEGTGCVFQVSRASISRQGGPLFHAWWADGLNDCETMWTV